MEEIGTITTQIKSDERQLLLFWALRRPMTIEAMRDRGYLGPEGLQPESYERTFRRFRQSFEKAGIVLQDVQLDGQTAYKIDEAATYVGKGLPGQQDLIELVALLSDYLASIDTHSDAAACGPYYDCLRRARDKLACISKTTRLLYGSAVQGDNAYLEGFASLLGAYVDCRGAEFDYRDADGVLSHRDADFYGFFRFSRNNFFVAYDHTRSAMRVFRVDRIDLDSVHITDRIFTVPDDFSVADYQGFPFEYGSDDVEARFEKLPGGDTWCVRVRDKQKALQWACEALEDNLVLQEPADLRNMLIDALKDVVVRHG